MKLSHQLRLLARPRVLLPTILTAALVAVVVKLADVPEVVDRIGAIPIPDLGFALTMALVYLSVKLWQLLVFLRRLGVRPGWRRLLLAFAVGELSLTLPFGLFAQNWVLKRSGAARFARTAAATVLMLVVETLVLLLLLAAAGLPRWPQVRPVAAALLGGMIVAAVGAVRLRRAARRLALRYRRPAVRHALLATSELLRAVRRLSKPVVLVKATALAAIYLGALAMAFWAVGRGVGLRPFGMLEAATIYAFSITVVLMLGGLVSQIGTIEILGTGAARAWGVSVGDGLALMIGFRVVWTAAVWLLALPWVIAFWRRLEPRLETPPAGASADQLEEAPD